MSSTMLGAGTHSTVIMHSTEKKKKELEADGEVSVDRDQGVTLLTYGMLELGSKPNWENREMLNFKDGILSPTSLLPTPQI